MGRLDEIPKKEIFNVPDGYFEKLPARIQSRLARPEATLPASSPWVRYALYTLPLLVVAMFILFGRSSSPEPASLLSSVETADLILYLQETGLSTEEMLDNVDLNTAEIDSLEDAVYEWNVQSSEDAFRDFYFDNL